MAYSKQELIEHLQTLPGLSDDPRVERVAELYFSDPTARREPGMGVLKDDADIVFNTAGYWDKAASEGIGEQDFDGGPATWPEELDNVTEDK